MAKLNQLSKREWEVVELLLQGKSNKLIASALGISIRTVEFHLKNIYAKNHVSSRTELILKLANATGVLETKKLGASTVDAAKKNSDNREKSLRDILSVLRQELTMKNLFRSKHVLVGIFSALLTGFLCLATLIRFGHTPLEGITPWIIPLIVTWSIIGLTVGAIGKINNNTLLKIFFSAVFGTGLSPIAILPITGFVIYPIAKFAEQLGLINPATMPRDVATNLVYIAMLAIWLIVGVAIGVILSYITIKKSGQINIQKNISEHGI